MTKTFNDYIHGLQNEFFQEIKEEEFTEEKLKEELESGERFGEFLDNEINILWCSLRSEILHDFGFGRALKIYIDTYGCRSLDGVEPHDLEKKLLYCLVLYKIGMDTYLLYKAWELLEIPELKKTEIAEQQVYGSIVLWTALKEEDNVCENCGCFINNERELDLMLCKKCAEENGDWN